MLPPPIADRSKFTSDYSLKLAINIALYASIHKHVLLCVALPTQAVFLPCETYHCDYIHINVTTLNPLNINCLMLRIKFAISRIFSLPYLWSPFFLGPTNSREETSKDMKRDLKSAIRQESGNPHRRR